MLRVCQFLSLFIFSFSIVNIAQASDYLPIVYEEIPAHKRPTSIVWPDSELTVNYSYTSSKYDINYTPYKGVIDQKVCTGSPDERHMCVKEFYESFKSTIPLTRETCEEYLDYGLRRGREPLSRTSCEIILRDDGCNVGNRNDGYAKSGYCQFNYRINFNYRDFRNYRIIDSSHIITANTVFYEHDDSDRVTYVCDDPQTTSVDFDTRFFWGKSDSLLADAPACAPKEQQFHDLLNIIPPMMSLYESLNGVSWLRNDNWLSEGTSICNWYSFSCNQVEDKEKRNEYYRIVTSIDLSNQELVGNIPDSFYFVIDSLLVHHADFTWNLGAKNPEINPLPQTVLTDYPLLLAKLKATPSLVTKFGDKVCYPDTEAFATEFEGTGWQQYICGTETESCPVENTGPECLSGNPINARTGIKIESSTDYSASGLSLLKVKRSYSSSKDSSKRSWQYNIATQKLLVSGNYVKLKGRSKSNDLFLCSGTAPSSCSARKLIGQSVIYQNYKLNKLVDGYELTLPSGAIETYSTTGQLVSTTNAQGRTLNYSYDVNTSTVTDEFSQSITLTTTADNLVTQAVTPIGTFIYGYDEFNRLTTVTKPDATIMDYRYDEEVYSTVQYNESETQTCSGDDYLTVEACTPLVKKLGLLTGKIDEKGQRYASWYYDEQQRAYKSEHGSGIDATEIQFVSEQGQSSTDAQGATVALQRVRDTISPLGLRTRTTFRAPYGQRAEKIETFDVVGILVSTETYSYDSYGYEAEHVDINGLKTIYSRYTDGREYRRIENAGTANTRTISTSYSGNTNKPTQITTPETRVNIVYISHNSGLLISKQTTTDLSTNKQRITNFSYNAQGQLISINGPRTDVNDITTFEYNAQGVKTKTTNALGHVTEITSFNAHGKPLTLVDENNITTTLTYDVMGRVKKIERAGTTQLFDYDLNGTLIKSTLANGSVIHYEYDVAQRLTAIRDSVGNRIEYVLDDAGNQLSTQVKNTSGTLLQSQGQLFDEFSRLVTITNGTSNSTQLDYLTNGNLDKSTDALNNPTSNSYDALQRLKDIHDSEGGKTTFGYDNAGRTTSITDATNKATTYTYNGFGELVKQVSPDSGETTFTYDKAGNLTSETDARGITVNYQYDALNRLTQTTYPDSVENIIFTYDNTANDNKGIGRLTGVNGAAGNRGYIYGELGQLLTENYTIGTQSYSLSYQYDAAGQLTSITYPSGRTVTYTLNTDGQITAMATLASGQSQTSQSLLTNATYLPFGPLSGFSYGNGLINSYNHDQNYRLIEHTLTGLKNQTLSYTDVGNINEISDSVNNANNTTFGYDKLSRLLTSADNNSADTSGNFIFTYDGIGNRQTKLNNNTAENYDYVANTHHLDKVTVDKEVQVSSYAGSFNQARRMDSAANVSYQYNYRELRVSKSTTNNEQTTGTHYHYDGNGLLIAESDHNGVWQKEYIYFNGQLIAMVDYDNGVAQPAYAVHTDHLGTPTQITNSAGTVIWQATYSPFGLATINNYVDGDSNKVELNIRFPGQYYDAETGLYYNWHRYYDPKIGRYITSDPLGLSAGINTYGYVGGNPVSYSDPSGLIAPVILACAANPACATAVATGVVVAGTWWANNNPWAYDSNNQYNVYGDDGHIDENDLIDNPPLPNGPFFDPNNDNCDENKRNLKILKERLARQKMNKISGFARNGAIGNQMSAATHAVRIRRIENAIKEYERAVSGCPPEQCE